MTVSSYSTTASSNTAINGVNISEGMSPSDVNNALENNLKMLDQYGMTKNGFISDGDGTTTFNRGLCYISNCCMLTLHQHIM